MQLEKREDWWNANWAQGMPSPCAVLVDLGAPAVFLDVLETSETVILYASILVKVAHGPW
jgi:hypothetical protein